MSTIELLNRMTQEIQNAGKMPVLDRLRALWGDEQVTDEERRVDLMFVHHFNEFPDSDEGLLMMYIAYTTGLTIALSND